MSYKDATAFAASLAATLMVSIVVFQAGDGTHGAMPSDEYNGDEDPRHLGNRPLAMRRESASPPIRERLSAHPSGETAPNRRVRQGRGRGGSGQGGPAETERAAAGSHVTRSPRRSRNDHPSSRPRCAGP